MDFSFDDLMTEDRNRRLISVKNLKLVPRALERISNNQAVFYSNN